MGEQYVDFLEREVKRLTQELEELNKKVFDDEYFKNALGGPYTPKKLRKYEAANAATIKRVLETAPDECSDIIAALIFFGCVAEQRHILLQDNDKEKSDEMKEALKKIADEKRWWTSNRIAKKALGL